MTSQSHEAGIGLRIWRFGRVPLGTGLLALARVGGSLAVTKGTAVLVGPAGLALLGAFQNLTAVALAFCSGGLSQGIVRTVAAAPDGRARREAAARLIRITLFATGVTVVCVFILARWLAHRVLGDAALEPVVHLFAALALGLALNTALLHVLVGYGRNRDFLVLNLYAALVTLIISLPMIFAFGLPGALLVAPVANSIVIVATWRRTRELDLWHLLREVRIERGFLAGLAAFPMMGMATATLLPIAQLVVRDRLMTASGAEAAGYWQGVVKVSDAYMMIVSFLVLMLLLPRFSIAATTTAKKLPLGRPALGIATLVILIVVPVFLLRDPLIDLLFTARFRSMRDLFAAQAVGDLMRALVLVVQAGCVAAVATGRYIVLEFLLAATFVGASLALIPGYGERGVVLGWSIAGTMTALAALLLRPRGTLRETAARG